MRLLLDTHVLLWALSEPARIPDPVAQALVDPGNEVVVSAATVWEIAIKQSLGKLQLPGPVEVWLFDAMAQTGLGWIDVSPEVAAGVRALPWHHRDPFDRILVSHASAGHTLVTHDAAFRPYGVPILWL